MNPDSCADTITSPDGTFERTYVPSAPVTDVSAPRRRRDRSWFREAGRRCRRLLVRGSAPARRPCGPRRWRRYRYLRSYRRRRRSDPAAAGGASAARRLVHATGGPLLDGVAVERLQRVVVRHEHFPLDDADRHVHFRQRHLHVALLARTACRHGGRRTTRRTDRVGRNPGRSSGTRVPSAPSTGFAGSPATSTDTIDAPGGQRDLQERLRAVLQRAARPRSARAPRSSRASSPTARSATAASTPASANRLTSSASAGGARGGALVAERRRASAAAPATAAAALSSRTSMRCMPLASRRAVSSSVPTPSMAISPRSRCASGTVTKPVSSANDPASCGRSRLTRNWWRRAAGSPTRQHDDAVARARSISSELPETPVTS